MAHNPAFQQPGMNRGTLAPGQAITVNKFNVQVERYLSQGGFAHVYLVRTAAPVYNTTHHVLKRIAVPSESMLTEVKKEVDIMRLLKGHPNIVHLIDAAWHRMPDGMYEVFILMEFCPGGGIIDMMNRRLRERLTEVEILQIFVDVCEGVAYMHNSRPPLLHRDLKVENILQSSPTSFKLCDFGSATTVGKVPSTTQEIRALEADLNRHTTLQYRAPEMVDPYLRRPVDEKSDVWALGVLLYKLCYYTTPFEEHGPLAILNVQYKIPPYPVYSAQMNSLIGSMLREHGTHRPSVFELLSVVHQMRGTKSQFHYTIPSVPPLSPHRPTPQSFQNMKAPVAVNPSETTIAYRAGSQLSNRLSPNKQSDTTQDTTPMRRGRPTPQPTTHSKPSSPLPPLRQPNAVETFNQEEEKGWKSATQQKPVPKASADDAWVVKQKPTEVPATTSQMSPQGFGDDFAENLWKSFDQKPGQAQEPTAHAPLKVPSAVPRTGSHTGGASASQSYKSPPSTASRGKDAFEGLGIDSTRNERAPTLGEARKLRTGLASMNSGSFNQGSNHRDSPSSSSSNGLLRPTPSPHVSSTRTQGLSSSPGSSHTTISTLPSWQSPSPASSRPPSSMGTSQSQGQGSQPAENRFPSLEELDAAFEPRQSGAPLPHAPSKPSMVGADSTSPASSRKTPSHPKMDSLRPAVQSKVSHGLDGVRSLQVTGTAMRDSEMSRRQGSTSTADDGSPEGRTAQHKSGSSSGTGRLDNSAILSRPTLVRKHRSTVNTKSSLSPQPSHREPDLTSPPSTGSEKQIARKPPPTDWLTGSDDENNHLSSLPTNKTSSSSHQVPVVRQSPSKRASYVERSNVPIQAAASAQAEAPPERKPIVIPSHSSRFSRPPQRTTSEMESPRVPGTTNRADTQPESWTPSKTPFTASKHSEPDSASSADEGPEDPTSSMRDRPDRKEGTPRRKGRQSSVHDLVDLYSSTSGASRASDKSSTGKPLIDIESTPKVMHKRASTTLQPPSMGSPSPFHRNHTETENKPSKPNLDLSWSKHSPLPSPVLSSSPSTSSAGGRSPRPQSMIIFPSSKSEGLRASDSPNLPSHMNPEHSSGRVIRRTSISDRVQQYEGMGVIRNKVAEPRSIVPKPSLENGRHHDAPGMDRQSNRSLPGTNTGGLGHRLPGMGGGGGGGGGGGSGGGASPTRQKRTSRFDQPSLSTAGAQEPHSPHPTASLSEPPKSVFPTRKPSFTLDRPSPISLEPTSGNASKPSASPTRSSSPERPYQGVGKLIDQWQRKATEGTPPKPTSTAAKRTSVIPGGLR